MRLYCDRLQTNRHSSSGQQEPTTTFVFTKTHGTITLYQILSLDPFRKRTNTSTSSYKNFQCITSIFSLKMVLFRSLYPTDLLLIDEDGTYCSKIGGLLMQKYYLKFSTALVILNITSVTSEEELLPHIAHSSVCICLFSERQEFEEYPIKQGQKSFLNSVWSKQGKYHYKGKVKETFQKVVALVMVETRLC